jgi:hypothetical protein
VRGGNVYGPLERLIYLSEKRFVDVRSVVVRVGGLDVVKLRKRREHLIVMMKIIFITTIFA